MTTEELKAHRRSICEALIEGKQCQYHLINEEDWMEQRPSYIASVLFASDESAQRIRIKPEPRKVWIGWIDKECGFYYTAATVYQRDQITDGASANGNAVKWQLVTEDPK